MARKKISKTVEETTSLTALPIGTTNDTAVVGKRKVAKKVVAKRNTGTGHNVTIRLTASEKTKLATLCKEQDRSMSYVLRKMIGNM